MNPNRNELYPVFLKVHQLDILIVGGGFVALEKLAFMLKSSPNASVSLVAKEFNPEVLQIIEEKRFDYQVKAYETSDLEGRSLVIGATDDEAVNIQICEDCRARKILVNIADNPPLCDFYLGGIVTKGHLKIAFSTNGKSPTMAKRLRQFFEEIFPEDINELLLKLNQYRKTLKGDFETKVAYMNDITKSFVGK